MSAPIIYILIFILLLIFVGAIRRNYINPFFTYNARAKFRLTTNYIRSIYFINK